MKERDEYDTQDPLEKKIARDTLERYSGSHPEEFQPYILLTNFSKHVDLFSELSGSPLQNGATMTSCHWPEKKISILDYKVGSPAAALAVDTLSYLNPVAGLMLGMCGGLRRKYEVGEYLLPVAAIRGEGTSDFYFPPNVPALANFAIQKTLAEVLERNNIPYHTGITHSTNIRFWEFNQSFRQQLIDEKAHGIEMECATLFISGYSRKFPIGALLLISDLPLTRSGIKTKKSSKRVSQKFSGRDVELGVEVMELLQKNAVEKIRIEY